MTDTGVSITKKKELSILYGIGGGMVNYLFIKNTPPFSIYYVSNFEISKQLMSTIFDAFGGYFLRLIFEKIRVNYKPICLRFFLFPCNSVHECNEKCIFSIKV